MLADNVNELDVAKKIRDGELTSPQKFGNMWLFNVRITGTGTAYRSRGDEFVFRPPKHYMTEEFLQRSNGLPLIWEHPEDGTLNSDEFKERVIGSIFLPYLKTEKEEVWGIAKVFDENAAELMCENKLSTSPTVVFQKIDKSNTITLDDGTSVLVEGASVLLDHVAVCENGVWDKGLTPNGVISDSNIFGATKMDEETMVDSTKEDEMSKRFDAMMSAVDSLTKRFDEFSAGNGKPEVAVPDAAEEEKCEAKEVVADTKEEEKEEKMEEKHKADSDEIKKRIDSVEAKLPKEITEEEYDKLADAQARADSVANAFGDSAPRPQLGESALAYRRRVAAKFKQHSPSYKNISLVSISDNSLFEIVEKQIYADALAAANNPVLESGEFLREIKTRTPAGHQVSTFKGAISSWTSNFKADAFKINSLNTGSK